MKEEKGMKGKMNRERLNGIIQGIYNGLEKNHYGTLGRPEDSMWEAPLVGIADGRDPYYDFLKEHIGPFHWSPTEVFQMKYPREEPANLRVVSMVFPQMRKTKDTQSQETICPSREWIVSRGEWEPLMEEFSGKLVEAMEKEGVRAVSIDLVPTFRAFRDERVGWVSSWSHRHSAYLAGLGTFGLSDGLITEKGKAHRITSLIVDAPIEISKMPYTSHTEWCLYYQDGSCMACVGRCPAMAISEKGHDKDLCGEYEDYFALHYWPSDIDRKDYIIGCGLCQAGVPCESKRP